MCLTPVFVPESGSSTRNLVSYLKNAFLASGLDASIEEGGLKGGHLYSGQQNGGSLGLTILVFVISSACYIHPPAGS